MTKYICWIWRLKLLDNWNWCLAFVNALCLLSVQNEGRSPGPSRVWVVQLYCLCKCDSPRWCQFLMQPQVCVQIFYLRNSQQNINLFLYMQGCFRSLAPFSWYKNMHILYFWARLCLSFFRCIYESLKALYFIVTPKCFWRENPSEHTNIMMYIVCSKNPQFW